jgi:hypothetical protein
MHDAVKFSHVRYSPVVIAGIVGGIEVIQPIPDGFLNTLMLRDVDYVIEASKGAAPDHSDAFRR